ncbi:glycosyltransferase family 2 protein [Coraliomargarita sp. W4R53]
MLPKISIVVPTYNRPEKLRRALDSCLWQSQLPLEVIVVDNGQNPATQIVVKDAIERAPSLPITYLASKPFDVRTALANGIEAANGDWLILLDDDDFLLKDRIENDTVMIRDIDEKTILLLQDFLRVDYKNDLVWEHKMGHKEIGLFQALTLDNFPPPPAATWRSHIAKKYHSFNEPHGGATDYEIYSNLLPYGNLQKTNRIGYVMDDTRVESRLTTSLSHMLDLVEPHRNRFRKYRHLVEESDEQIENRLNQQQAFFFAKVLKFKAFFGTTGQLCRAHPKETLKGILAPLRGLCTRYFSALLPEIRGSKTYSLEKFGQHQVELKKLIEDSRL